ncbi:MAG: disulfide bond formation protein B [Geminicoccaceae bacterium]|nr:MAG: disulfide bond formation protein B [Geminicoccaceae bacterium]
MIDRLALGGFLVASAGALVLALYVQYMMGYAPCSLCLHARVPHVVLLVAVAGTLVLGWPRLGLALTALLMLAVFAISLRHLGVEAGWLALPEACRVPDITGDFDRLRQAMLAQTQPACDVEGPVVLGLSMAGWHALYGLGGALVAALLLSRHGAAAR